jgi:hypothetical protein
VSDHFGHALNFEKSLLKDATKVGAKLFQSGVTDAKAIAQHIPKSMFSLANPAQLATSLAAGAGAIATGLRATSRLSFPMEGLTYGQL